MWLTTNLIMQIKLFVFASLFNSYLKTHQNLTYFGEPKCTASVCLRVSGVQPGSSEWALGHNILSGLSLPHIYIIKMRPVARQVTEGARGKSGPCQSCHLLHWPKGPDPNPIHCRGGEGGNGDDGRRRGRQVVIGGRGKTGWQQK